jgi:hypothetical protein
MDVAYIVLYVFQVIAILCPCSAAGKTTPQNNASEQVERHVENALDSWQQFHEHDLAFA